MRKFYGNILEMYQIFRVGWIFDFEIGFIEVVVMFECFNNQIVDCDENEKMILVLLFLWKKYYLGVN